MKVLHLCSDYYKMYGNLMRRLISRGINISVFQFISKQKTIEFQEDFLDTYQCFNEIDRYFFLIKETKVLKTLYREYKIEEFDYIHAHTIFSNGYLAYKIKKDMKIPYSVAVVNTDLNVFFRLRPNLKRIGLNVLKEADQVIFHSPAYRDYMVETYIPKSMRDQILDKSTIIPLGIEKVFLNNKYETKRKLGAKIKIITASNITKNKNHISVCKALEKLQKHNYQVEYTIIGKVLEPKTLMKIEKFSFVKYYSYMTQDELISAYRSNDIFVMPSIFETFGMVYAEAMSQGLPIIYSRGQGFDQQFPDGEIGYSVDAENNEEIARAIFKIVENYSELSNRCIKLVNKFDWESITEKYVHIYKANIERNKGGQYDYR